MRTSTQMTSLKEESDAELLKRIVDQDEDAFEELYRRYWGSLRTWLRSIVRDEQHATEVTQETFLSIWAKAAMFDPQRGSVRQWIAAIGRNKLLDQMRRIQREIRLVNMLREEPRQTRERNLTDFFIGMKKAQDLLTPRERELFELIYHRGFTLDECANQLGSPTGTIKWQAYKIHAKLRKFFSTKSEGPGNSEDDGKGPKT